MKLAFTTKGTDWDSPMDPRFGRTEYFLIYDEESKELKAIDNSKAAKEAHGVGPQAAKIIFDQHAKVLITGNGAGGNAKTILEKTGIESFIGALNITVKEAYDAYKKGTLNKV